MKFNIQLLLIVGLILASSCRSKYYTNTQRSHVIREQHQYEIIVDHKNYDLYVRQVCRYSPKRDFYQQHSPETYAPVERDNCESMISTKPKERVEIEYLLISKSTHKAIYISTIPPSLLYNKYTYNGRLFDSTHFVNINYFNLFEFGQMNDSCNRVSFRDKKKDKIYSWDLLMDKDCVSIESFTEDGKQPKHVTNSLSFPVKFYKQSSFKFILQGKTDTSFNAGDGNLLEDNSIRILSLKRHRFRVLFHFNLPFDNDSEYQWLFFDNKRVYSDPLFYERSKK